MSRLGSNYPGDADDIESLSGGDTVSFSGGDTTVLVGHSGSKPVSSSTYGSLGSHAREADQQHQSWTDTKNVTPSQSSRRANNYIYCSHFLSAWGDRMWSFGVGLFLVRIADNNLQLPAIYGLTSGLTIFLMGALVGDWVDSTPRLKAAQLSLVWQNLLVVICAVGVYAYIRWEVDILGQPGGWSVPLCHAAVITLAVGADLTSMARVIAVEKDWIVKICGRDTDMLAKMTATLRRIDQTTLIVAPIATGQVMTYASLEVGALFIAVWNLGSVLLEYYLMWKVYTTVPALAAKEGTSEEETPLLKDEASTVGRDTASSLAAKRRAESETTLSSTASQWPLPEIRTHSPPPPSPPPSPADAAFRSDPLSQPGLEAEDCLVVKTTPQWNEFSKSYRTDIVGTLVVDTEILLDESEDVSRDAVPGGRAQGQGCCICHRFSGLYEGWMQYKKYTVALAGLALSFLFMTVLGFDNITVAYAVTQGVSESILGIMMAVSAVFGMLGTFIYPIWRRRVGLVRTGMLALSCQVACLSLCVLSVWMPGSPFDPTYSSPPAAAVTAVMPSGSTTWNTSAQMTIWPTPDPFVNRSTSTDVTLPLPNVTAIVTSSNTITSSPWSTPIISSTAQVPLLLNTTTPSDQVTPQSLNFALNSDVLLTTPQNYSSNSTEGSLQTTSWSDTASGTSNLSPNTPEQLTTPDIMSSRTAPTGGPMTPSSETRSSLSSVKGSTEDAAGSGELTEQTMSSYGSAAVTTSSTPSEGDSSEPVSYVSVSLFLAGIVLARFGLWTADLAITQMFLEAVKEGERGAVNGVQNSLNQLFNVLKFLLVVLIPDTQTFGILILLSFSFICAAWVLYAVFLRKARGHFFPKVLLRCGGHDDLDYTRL